MDMNTPVGGISPQDREQIVRGFESWLDRALAQEEPPQGLTAELLAALANGEELPPITGAEDEQGCDLYSLWSAMTALTQEVRLQGRSFKQLNETLMQSAQSLESDDAAEVDQAEEARNAQLAEKAAARQPRKQEIDVLLDLRDRMERSGATARSAAEELAPARLPLMARLLGAGRGYAHHAQEILAALVQGYSLTLDTLDEALVACRVSRIPCQGLPFDPQRMNAIDIAETSEVAEGTVVEIYRNGYEWNGEVYRTAQVKVARSPIKKLAG